MRVHQNLGSFQGIAMMRYTQNSQGNRRWSGLSAALGRAETCPGAPRPRRMGRYVGTLWVVLSLLALIAASGPHLVHHLADSHPSDNQPSPQSHACLVLSLMQQTPVAQGEGALLPVPLPSGERAVFTSPAHRLDGPGHVCQARAPPAAFLSSMPYA
ncbi:MAG TPA: hypothetical protein VIH59_23885 [Candidatus Tectomicrobia bacterium]|jgi:hypothetical protein